METTLRCVASHSRVVISKKVKMKFENLQKSDLFCRNLISLANLHWMIDTLEKLINFLFPLHFPFIYLLLIYLHLVSCVWIFSSLNNVCRKLSEKRVDYFGQILSVEVWSPHRSDLSIQGGCHCYFLRKNFYVGQKNFVILPSYESGINTSIISYLL